MNFLKTKVSGNKKRFIDKDYNLDLSYITPKIIAMAFPGSSLRKLYRNSIDDVAQFFKIQHNNNYLVINLSGVHYDNSKFLNKVLEFDWIDHQAPKLSDLFFICDKMYNFLLSNPDNIVAINCRAGKGRTGTIICCFLLFVGLFISVEETMKYYSLKRFYLGEGVTQPSQRRYIYLFHRLLKDRIYFPMVVNIEGIYLKNIPYKSDECIKPYVNINIDNSSTISYTTRKNIQKIYCGNSDEIEITNSCDFKFEAVGDITISIFDYQTLNDSTLGRIAINTAFLDEDKKIIEFSISQIDPDNLVTKKNWNKEYSISVSIKGHIRIRIILYIDLHLFFVLFL